MEQPAHLDMRGRAFLFAAQGDDVLVERRTDDVLYRPYPAIRQKGRAASKQTRDDGRGHAPCTASLSQNLTCAGIHAPQGVGGGAAPFWSEEAGSAGRRLE